MPQPSTKKTRRRNHEGGLSLIKHGARAGLYVGTVTLPGGTRQYIYGADEQAVIAEMNRLKGALARGELAASNRTPLAEYLEWWLEAVVPTVGYNAGRSYRQRVARLLKWSNIGTKRLGSLAALDVQRAVSALMPHYAPETVRQSRGILTHALGDAVRWRLIPANVAALTDSPRVPKHEPRILEEAEVQLLRDGTRGDTYHALWMLMVTTGLRLGEATALRWRDLDLRRGRVTVGRTIYRVAGAGMVPAETKTSGSRREVRLAPWVVAVLKAHKAGQAEAKLWAGADWNRGDLVFCTQRGNATDPSNLHRIWDRSLARLGLPEINPHDLRHTAASLLLRRGVHPKKVQAMLGHSSIRTTMDLYSHLVPGDLQQTADEMEMMFGDGPSTGVIVAETVAEASE